MKKLTDNDLLDFLRSADIVMLVETWIHERFDLDIVNSKFIEYTHFSSCRPKTICFRGHGGISVLLRNNNVINPKQIYSESDNIVWVICKLNYVKTLIGIVYYAPDKSPYAKERTIDILNEELQHISSTHCPDNICVFGDLNGRVGSSMMDVHNRFEYFPPRTSQDTVVNARGRDIIDFCQSSGLIIAIGRVGQDAGHGKFTCIRTQGCSMVDYLLVNEDFLNRLTDFKICDEIISDHMPLTCKIGQTEQHDIINTPGENNGDIVSYNKIIWSAECEHHLKSALNTREVQQEFDNILKLCDDNEPDSIVHSLYSIIYKCCQPYVKKPRPLKNIFQKLSGPKWFDEECSNKKSVSRYFLTKFRQNRSSLSLKNYVTCKREYTIMKRRKRLNYEREMRNRLLSADNNAFWKILKEDKLVNQLPQLSSQYKFEYFAELYSKKPETTFDLYLPDQKIYEPELDREITGDDVKRAIKTAKPHRTGGIDGIPIDLWKSLPQLHHVIARVLNCLYGAGAYPEEWRTSVIVALHKSGDYYDLNNYRGISLLPALCKISSSIFASRLSNFLESRDLLLETQAGYRPGYSTLDNLLIFDCIITKFQKNNDKLFCAFVDFKKAYDYVNRSKLLYKLHKIGISTKLVNYLKAVYQTVRGAVKVGPQHTTMSFNSFDGVRQGENVSSILFSIYINDLSQFLYDNGASDVQIGLLYLTLLLFADDLVMIDKTAKGLQRKLNLLHQFCELWDLKANEKKTKVMVVGKNNTNFRWKLNESELEVVNMYNYVGLTLTSAGNWKNAVTDQCNKAKRAIFSLCNSMKTFGNPDPRTMLKLFDSKIKPILLYGCEIWGFVGIPDVEIVTTNYYRKLLGLRKNCSVIFVQSELGRLPLSCSIYQRIIRFWVKIVTNQNKAVFKAYKNQRFLANTGVKCWAKEVKDLLFSSGFGRVWIEQDNIPEPDLFLSEFSQRCIDMARQEWHSKFMGSTMLRNYRKFKSSLSFEKYLNMGLSTSTINWIARLRGAMLRIRVNEGRWNRTPFENRICPVCNLRQIEDEEHLLFHCPVWNGYRDQLLQFANFQKFNLSLMLHNANREFFVLLASVLEKVMFIRTEFLTVLE